MALLLNWIFSEMLINHEFGTNAITDMFPLISVRIDMQNRHERISGLEHTTPFFIADSIPPVSCGDYLLSTTRK